MREYLDKRRVPAEARELVLGTLEVDPAKRLTITQVINSPYFAGYRASEPPVTNALERVRRAEVWCISPGVDAHAHARAKCIIDMYQACMEMQLPIKVKFLCVALFDGCSLNRMTPETLASCVYLASCVNGNYLYTGSYYLPFRKDPIYDENTRIYGVDLNLLGDVFGVSKLRELKAIERVAEELNYDFYRPTEIDFLVAINAENALSGSQFADAAILLQAVLVYAESRKYGPEELVRGVLEIVERRELSATGATLLGLLRQFPRDYPDVIKEVANIISS
ncbi:MAG: hypothetical protein ACYCOU_00675 [Sulfobacillus sp.]